VHTIEVQQSPTLAHSPYHVPTIGQTLKLDIQEANIYAKLGLAWLTEVEPDSLLERRWGASEHFQSHASIRLKQAYHHKFMCPPRAPNPRGGGPPTHLPGPMSVALNHTAHTSVPHDTEKCQ
jgi:hypothetical protein